MDGTAACEHGLGLPGAKSGCTVRLGGMLSQYVHAAGAGGRASGFLCLGNGHPAFGRWLNFARNTEIHPARTR